MSNFALIRRFIFGSIILALAIPATYHIATNVMRGNHFARLAKQVCKAIEPRIQIGAQREALEFLKSAVTSQGTEALPEIEFKDHGRLITPPIREKSSMGHEPCVFPGFDGVEVAIYYHYAPLLNIFYPYIYLLSVPILFALLFGVRLGVLSLQRKVADIIEKQMKQLLGMGSFSEPQKASLLSKLLDLEIPLLKYLKGHIENLEMDLERYSQKIVEQQKQEVLMDVAAQMAHDIVTPISNLQKILASDEKKYHQDLILTELGQIKNLSEKMLRQYRGDTAIQKNEVIDVVDCTKAAIESIKLFAQEVRPVDFQFNCDSQTTVKLKGDRTQFIAAISNILRNSVEAIDKSLGHIILNLNVTTDFVELMISDNGGGIKAEDLSRIFDNKISIGKAIGTGIGLYQVRSVIEEMKGSVIAESTLGVGTTLKLTWPVSAVRVQKTKLQFQSDAFIQNRQPDLVLIDDSNANHTSWGIQAKRAHQNLLSLSSWDEFVTVAGGIDKSVPIFVDYNFEDQILSGKEIAEKVISSGFQSVYITTGLPAEYVDKPMGVKAVLNKDFPAIKFL